MLELTPIFVLLIIFGFVYAVIHLSIRRKERMTMLEKGADPSIFNVENKGSKMATLKWGMILIGLACGLLLGRILEVYGIFYQAEEVGYFSMLFLFGGIALVISYFIEKASKS
jgi:hypothetical protein